MLEVRRTTKEKRPRKQDYQTPAAFFTLSKRNEIGFKLNGLELDGRRRGMLLQESLDGRLAVSGAQAPVGLRAQRAK